jgi:hypothetical protein
VAGHGEVEQVVAHILKARVQIEKQGRNNGSKLPARFSKQAILPKLLETLLSQ